MTSRRDDPFLASYEWRAVRMMVIERDGARCAACGRTAAHGITINVDHIKCRKRHPELALTLANLQVLCDECNHGKGNKYETDWRSASRGVPRKQQTLETQMLLGLVLLPRLAKTLPFPRSCQAESILGTISEVAAYCNQSDDQLDGGALLKAFSGSWHEPDLLATVVYIEERGRDSFPADEMIEASLRDTLARWWQRKRFRERSDPATEQRS